MICLPLRQLPCLWACILSRHIPLHHLARKLGKLPRLQRRTGAVRSFPAGGWRKTQCNRRVKFRQGRHLPVVPLQRPRTAPVRPTDARAQFFHPHFSQPFHREFQPVVLEMKPLANAQFRAEVAQRRLGCAILANQPHVKMPVVSTALGLLMARGGLPLARQIQQAVPKNSLGAPQQQFRRALQTEDLDFIRPERRYADFRHPDGQRGHRPDFIQFLRPIVDLPMVPIQREAMHRHAVQMVEQAIALQQGNELRINGRDSAQDQGQRRAQFPDANGGHSRHLGELLPVRVHLEVPMRQVVRLVPQLDCFDHRLSFVPQ